METIGGFASFLNGKIECPHHTVVLLLNSSLPSILWCYTAETATDIYRYA